MMRFIMIVGPGLILAGLPAFAERINQEGRILGPAPVVTNSILFDTTNADAVVAAMQIFPVTNPWNEDISNRPILTNSDAIIAQIISDLSASRRTLRTFFEMNYVLVPDNQPLVPIDFFNYPEESDPSPYPIPSNLPIEGWPLEVTNTLQSWQQTDDGSDRHAIIVQPGRGLIWETWETLRVGTNWQASNGAQFNLNTNGLRPDGWTSGDAAGLPMFPALPRFDECERGMVEHACRIVVGRSLYNAYIYPATHYASASTNTNPNLPAMGQRVRLKSSFVIQTNWATEEKALLLGLKKYGALVADNGNFFSISVTPDERWPSSAFSHISTIGITNFEVIQTTGTNEGPRSPGAPAASAGPDQSVPVTQLAQLQGFISFAGSPPAIQWKLYSGPGTVSFGNPAQTNTTARFSTAGTYTLMLSAADGIHAVAYDAVVLTVTQAISLTISRVGTNVSLAWTGGSPPYIVEQAAALSPASWSGMVTTSVQNVSVPVTSSESFFRVRN